MAMEEHEARALLGVGDGATAAEVRAAFRHGLHRAHPDVAPGDPHAARRTSLLVEAYALLRRPAPPPHETAHPTLDGDSLTWDQPAEEVFRRLVEVADRIGDITYLDPGARLLDTVVVVEDVACSLLATLQGRAAGTEVFFSLEPLGSERRPAIAPVVAAVAELLDEDTAS